VFNKDGSFAIQMPGQSASVNVQSSGATQQSQGSTHDGGGGGGGRTAPSLDLGDIQQLAQDVTVGRSNNCLVTADTSPCEAIPAASPPANAVPAGAFDVVSTEVSLDWLIDKAAYAAVNDAPLPAIKLGMNPDRGLAQLDSWFWVDRATYDGQPYTFAVEMPDPWTLDWKTIVHHHDTESGPCADAPNQTCTTSHDWDEIISHHENHLDVVRVTVTLSPAQYSWNFGDGGSTAVFHDGAGLGRPYTNPNTPSTVAHKYHFSSAKVYYQGGFLVDLKAAWSLSGQIVATRDGAVVQQDTRVLPSRSADYSARYQVRESQPVLVRSAP
jgi:hypothetical protein